MLRFPVHPRLGRLLAEGQDRGVPALACGAAALLGERSVRPGNHQAHTDADADPLVDLAEIDAMRRRGPADDTPRGGLLPGPARRVLQVRDQLLRLCERPDPGDMSDRTGRKRHGEKDMSLQAREDALRRALLAAFSDRVALARADTNGDRVLALASGGAARLGPASVVRSAPWLLALAVEQRQEGLRGSQIVVRSACAIEPDWLLDDLTDEIVASDELSFNPQRERVEGRSELRYHGLLIESTPHRKLPPAASQVLRDAALAAGPARFVGEPDALADLQARTAFVATHVPGFPALGRRRDPRRPRRPL
jgi:ATP-dependent helicase HrpB